MLEHKDDIQEPLDSASSDDVKISKVKLFTNLLLLLILLLLVFSIVSDRIIPLTDNARIKSYIVPIVPEVSGTVLDIKVKPNALVNEGDVLAILEQTDYDIAVQQAEQNLRIAGQNVGAQTANIAAAQARLTAAMVEQQNVQLQSNRVLAIAEQGVVSKSEADKARAALAAARAQVTNARADLEKAKRQLGEEGNDNSQIQAALLALEKAQLNLSRTVIHAPTRGGVSNFSLSEGFFAVAGQPLMTFISTDEIWIEAYFRENSLGNVTAGNRVEIALDFAPGTVVKGRVVSVDWGIDWGQNNQAGKLAQSNQQSGWLRQTQMLPVTIEFDRDAVSGLLRVGGQADVIIYTSDNALLNTVGQAWIRIISWLSYVR